MSEIKEVDSFGFISEEIKSSENDEEQYEKDKENSSELVDLAPN